MFGGPGDDTITVLGGEFAWRKGALWSELANYYYAIGAFSLPSAAGPRLAGLIPDRTFNFITYNVFDGDDTINGGSEDDLLFGGPGRDGLDGAAGIDICNAQTGGGSAASCEVVI